MILSKLSYPTCALASKVEFFTTDTMIKGYHVYKNVWSIFKCCTVTMIKEVEKGLSGRHLWLATTKAAEMSTFQSTCKETYVKQITGHRIVTHAEQSLS